MAAPTDAARNATNTSTAATSVNITVGSPASGVLLIVFVRFAADPGAVTFTGYNLIANDASDASDDTTVIYWRIASGAEGATATITTVNSVKSGAICWQVTGAANDAPLVSTVAVGTTVANTCDPAVVAPLIPSQDTLYIVMGGEDQEVGTFSAAPANYTNLVNANSGTGGVAATNVLMGGASRQLTASSSDNAGVFTHAAAVTGWTAFAIAIRALQPIILREKALQSVNRSASF